MWINKGKIKKRRGTSKAGAGGRQKDDHNVKGKE
jgi:hypothetical protein